MADEEARTLDELKQACLDLADAASKMFDQLDEHGLEAAWEGDGVDVVLRMHASYKTVTGFIKRQADRRITAIDAPPGRDHDAIGPGA